MNPIAKLYIGNHERELHSTQINYHRGTRINGKPSTETMGGMVHMTFTPRGDEDIILDWMFANRMDDKSIDYPYCLYVLKEAEIVFYEGDYNGQILYKYKLDDCVCVYYRESFSNQWGMQTEIVLSAAIQQYKDQPFVKRWNENWSPPNKKTPYQPKEDLTPKVLDYYLTNENNERIEKTQFESFVYLNIETKNLIGKIINVNLNNPRADFSYNNEKLVDDMLNNFEIKSDSKKIKLQVFKEGGI